MQNIIRIFIAIPILFFSCNTGNLEVISDISNELREVSGIEISGNQNLYWVIEDSGNQNRLMALDSTGNISASYILKNTRNIDWEDLTTDQNGNIYIGDFGNNGRQRKTFTIYKVVLGNNNKTIIKTENIVFKLPENENPLDFEAFFILNNTFYIFSKDNTESKTFKVPNISGNHVAEHVLTHNFDRGRASITSADISLDGKTVVLLNRSGLWILSNFTEDDFFSGTATYKTFKHTSQKEGICFLDAERILITDENTGWGSNIYLYSL